MVSCTMEQDRDRERSEGKPKEHKNSKHGARTKESKASREQWVSQAHFTARPATARG
jgi:hypothetical protein